MRLPGPADLYFVIFMFVNPRPCCKTQVLVDVVPEVLVEVM